MTQSQILNANFDWLQVGKKEHFPEYKIQTQKTMFDRISQAKRSTFDRSKFEVVGSPNIKEDGIASGFSGGSYLNIELPYTSSKKIIVTNKVKVTSFSISAVPHRVASVILLNSTNIEVYCNYLATSPLRKTINLDTNKFYTITEIFDIQNTKYIIKIIDDSNNIIVNEEAILKNDSISLSQCKIGQNSSVQYLIGQIDLSQFSITVDGVEVFNGNKTGVDQIKKDDYTVVGSPVISADGIASGFAKTTNYISIPTSDLASANSWDIYLFLEKLDTRTQQIIVSNLANNNGNFAVLMQSNNMSLFAGSGSAGNYDIANGTWGSAILQNEKDTYINIGYDDNSYYAKISYNAKDWSTVFSIQTNLKANMGSRLAIGSNSYWNQLNSNVDLNKLKKFVDGQLVYQPTLRIPYTQSKTGSKIVDAVYRDRVQDMYEQFGYTHYYTLGEDNYTLQTVPNEKIIDSYYADNSFMELTADLSLTQAGDAVSGQTVNLKRPYKDNKYISTIGTTSKATNSFVASASGQWITKGKGVLG